MCAYNRINGVYASEAQTVVNDILRQEWGFDGIVISDWGSGQKTGLFLLASVEMCMPHQRKPDNSCRKLTSRGLSTKA